MNLNSVVHTDNYKCEGITQKRDGITSRPTVQLLTADIDMSVRHICSLSEIEVTVPDQALNWLIRLTHPVIKALHPECVNEKK